MLSTLNKLARRLSIDTTDQAILRVLSDLLIAADAAVKSYCRWQLEAADVTEYHDYGCRDLVLEQFYVTAVTGTSVDDDDLDYGVWIDGDRAWAADTKLAATDFRLIRSGTSGILHLFTSSLSFSATGSWGWGWCGSDSTEVIRVIYRAGFEEDAIPADLSDAVDQLAAASYGTRLSAGTGSGSVKQERRGQSAVTYFSPGELLTSSSTTGSSGTRSEVMQVKGILDRYRDWKQGTS